MVIMDGKEWKFAVLFLCSCLVAFTAKNTTNWRIFCSGHGKEWNCVLFVCLLVWMGLGLVTCLFSIFLCDNMVGMFCFLV